MRSSFYICLLLGTILLCSGNLLSAQPTLHLTGPGQAPYSYPDQSGFFDRWMKAAFERANLSFTYKWLPPERSLINANAGLSDGDAARIAGLSTLYPNLIQVPEKVYTGDFVAFSKSAFPVNGWDSLKSHDVGIIRGHKICEVNISGPESLTKVDTIPDLFRLLENDRVDVVVVERMMGLAALYELGFQDILVLEPPLAQLDFFLYLHRKHEALVPAISEALLSIRNDGTHRRISEDVMRRVMSLPAGGDKLP